MSPKGPSKLAITRKKGYRLQDSLQRLTAWSINQNWSNIIFVSEPLYSVCAQLTYIDLKYRPFIWKNCLGTFGKIIQDKWIHWGTYGQSEWNVTACDLPNVTRTSGEENEHLNGSLLMEWGDGGIADNRWPLWKIPVRFKLICGRLMLH